ncbi:MAG TPA: hypothetical protein VMI75_28765 [Polyangiaceae bacterium]|nr:hypothetical protein [Polyangiaceae bacterium]
MSAAVATFLFETVNFVLLAAALGWVFLKPMRRLVDRERADRAQAQDAIARGREELERSREELASRLGAIQEEAERIRSGARAEAEREAARILQVAHDQVAEERSRAELEAEGQRQNEIAALAQEVGKIAAKLVLDVFARAGAEADVALARAAGSELATLARHEPHHVLVESARPLGEDVRRVLRSELGPAFDSAQTRVVPELVAGVRIASDEGLVDASARGLAASAERALTSGGIDVRS